MVERIQAKLAELKARRAELAMGLQQHEGAIAVLEQLLNEAQLPAPPPKEA